MKKGNFQWVLAVIFLSFPIAFFSGITAAAEKPIVIGAPLATAFLYGWDAERGIKLAVEEINAAGGVSVGRTKRPFKVEVIDTRDLEAGVPVSDALLGVEKLILEKGADFIVGGPVRSEAALAAMDLLNRYKKVSILTTGVLTPEYHKKVEENYDKYKYCFRPEETARSYIAIGNDIYYRMGDFMRFDEEGELEFVERTADIIKYKGYRVSAPEVEAALQDHPAVIGACVVGVPDASSGERIKAIVVLKHDAKGVASTDLTKWCRDRLAPYKVPSYIEFRDMLPKSKVGKLLRREIRDEERRKRG